MKPLKDIKLVMADIVAAHGDTYSYDDFVFEGVNKKAKITCRTHGNFEQTPKMHYARKRGCPKCWEERNGKGRRFDTEQFIEKSKKKFGDLYDYSKSKLEFPPIHADFGSCLAARIDNRT